MIIWKRGISIATAGLTITELKIAIDIRREVSEPPTGNATIWNLSPDHQDQIRKHGTRATVAAGYGGDLLQVFDGMVQEVMHERKHLAVLTKMRLGPYASARQDDRITGFTMRVWAGKAAVADIVADIVKDFAPPDGEVLALGNPGLLDGLTVEGWRWEGSTSHALDTLLAGFNLTWREDDGVIVFNQVGRLDDDLPEVRVSRWTGLQGTPIPTDEGVECVSFMRPSARIGARLRLDSDRLSGTYKIVGLHHKGDNWEGGFSTRFRLRPL